MDDSKIPALYLGGANEYEKIVILILMFFVCDVICAFGMGERVAQVCILS
jgi:hypothetical protein